MDVQLQKLSSSSKYKGGSRYITIVVLKPATHVDPLVQLVLLVVPVDLQTDRVVLHLGVVNVLVGHTVEVLPPDQLSCQMVGRRLLGRLKNS